DRSFEFAVDHIGFEISQEFVVGYGLDYKGKFRHLDSIYIIE
ncbi:MAG: hypoxanthine phosphoribosyltransferase, partial [bacterium TMED264]